MSRHALPLLLIASVAFPSVGRAQSAHADDVEVIKPPEVKPAPDEQKPDLSAAVKLVIDQTNEFRKAEGKSPVEVNDKLTAAATYFAEYMAKNDRYGHTADGSGPADRATKHGYEYCIVLENIAYQYNSRGFATEDLGGKFVTGWKKSPGHRRNMLDADVSDTGVAIARSENTGYYYAVQMFGRPKSKAIEFQVTNQADAAVNYVIGEEKFTLEPRYTRTHTRCRPAELVVTLPGPEDAKPATQTFRPARGEHLIVTKTADGYAAKKE